MCQWEKEKIIVNGTVTIEAPYSPSNIKGNEKEVAEVREWVSQSFLYWNLVNENEVIFIVCVFNKKQKESELPESNQRPLDCCDAATTV